MSFNKTLMTVAACAAFLNFGCGGGATTNTNAPSNANAIGATNAANAAGNTLGTTKTPEKATQNQGETLKPVVTAYYNALKNKDDAALRKVYSQATLKSLEADMKSEGETSLLKFITDLEPVPSKPFEVRNEEIQGDTAVAEMRGGSYPNGIRIKFVKENGEWKMTTESPDINSVRQGTNGSNTAK